MDGNYRAERSWLYLTDRAQTTASTNIREDGLFATFNPFWLSNSGNDWSMDNTNWTFTSEVSKFSPYGFEVENRDALGRYSSALYGYNFSLPTAVSSNAKYQQIGFDNFEDYDFISCDKRHFSFDDLGLMPVIDKNESHSGRQSIKLSSGETIKKKKKIECE